MLLEEKYHQEIENLIRTYDFGWRYNPNTLGKFYPPNSDLEYDSFQLTHVMYFENKVQTRDDFWKIITPLIDKINPSELFKVKVNRLFPYANSKKYHIPHWDRDVSGFKTMIYYVDDSDGDTYVFDKCCHEGNHDLKIIHSETPERGKAIVFESDRYHSSSNPKKHSDRTVINLVYR